MALKVLLADESTSIKKAFQLALADYAVEVKSVPSGHEVLEVCLDFKPDIIFADILLTKKSGYEVCKDIRSNNQLSKTPLILMWSHFMEFDSTLAESVSFTGKLEKPFDTETLRILIEKHVVKVQKHPTQGMIDFPKMPEFVESKSEIESRIQAQIGSKTESQSELKTDLKSEVKSNFKSIAPAPIHTTLNQLIESDEINEDFSSVKLNSNDFDIQIETENYGDFEEVVLVKSDAATGLQNRIQEQIQNYLGNTPLSLNSHDLIKSPHAVSKNQSFDETLMREEVRIMTEKICWQIIPDIAEKIIREEITKLLSNIDKSI